MGLIPSPVQRFKDLALLQLQYRSQRQLGCHPWPGKFHMPRGQALKSLAHSHNTMGQSGSCQWLLGCLTSVGNYSFFFSLNNRKMLEVRLMLFVKDILERAVHYQLSWQVESGNLLPEKQKQSRCSTCCGLLLRSVEVF